MGHVKVSIINQTLSRLYKKLSKLEQKDGSYLSYSSPDITMVMNCTPYRTVFTNALVLSATRKPGPQYLLSQKSKNWTFNYWDRGSPEFDKIPYPDDLDDTFCALAALQTFDHTLITGDVLARAVQLLTALEVKEGGPYTTWIVGKTAGKEWKDVDLAVNNNIAYFLFLNDIELPSLTQLTENAIRNKHFISPYYPKAYPVIYFIARWYRGRLKETLAKHICSILDTQDRALSTLDMACLLTALMNLGFSDSKLDIHFARFVEKLDEMMLTHNSVQSYVFYIGINPDSAKKKPNTTMYYAGSPALTTALSIEALEKYRKILKGKASSSKAKKRVANSEPQHIHASVIKEVKKRLSHVSPDVHHLAEHYLDALRATDKDVHIVLLPYYFAAARYPENDLSDDFFCKLGCANMCGWLSYTIYDNFLDEEGNPAHLSLANVCLRELTDIFVSILPTVPAFRKTFHAIMDRIDAANTWETTYCRFPPGIPPVRTPHFKNHAILADKSIGHVLGPIAVIHALSPQPHVKAELHACETFFTHYLIARQLNDDAHDWKEDLLKGHVNAVSAAVLNDARKAGIENLDFDALDSVFWNKTIVSTSSIILKHTNNAQKIADSNYRSHPFFSNLLLSSRTAAQDTLNKQKNASEFISSFSSKAF